MIQDRVLYVMTAYHGRLSGEEVACKIGITRSIDSRHAVIQTGCPFRVEIAGIYDDMPNGAAWCESLALSALKDFRLMGEWICLPSAAVLTGLDFIMYSHSGAACAGPRPPGVPDSIWYREEFMRGVNIVMDEMLRRAA